MVKPRKGRNKRTHVSQVPRATLSALHSRVPDLGTTDVLGQITPRHGGPSNDLLS